SAFRLHLPAKRRVLDDVLLRVRKIVFGENRAHPGAPATIGFQIGDNFRRLHRLNISRTGHKQSIETLDRYNRLFLFRRSGLGVVFRYYEARSRKQTEFWLAPRYSRLVNKKRR